MKQYISKEGWNGAGWYSLTDIEKSGVLICGKPRGYLVLSKLVKLYKLKHEKFKGTLLYKVTDLEKAYPQYEAEYKKKGTNVVDEDLITLKKEKLQNEIIKQELEIESLKMKLIDYDEVLEYLIKRKSVEVAVLRRILLSVIPVEVTGLTPPEAREKCTTYFNEIIEEVNSTIKKWEDEFVMETNKDKDDTQDA